MVVVWSFLSRERKSSDQVISTHITSSIFHRQLVPANHIGHDINNIIFCCIATVRIYRTGGIDPAMVHLERNLISISLKEQLLARPAVEDLEKRGIKPREGSKVNSGALR